MTSTNGPAMDFALTLTEEERAQLLNWLERRQRTTLLEEHRTETADYRDYLLHQEEILEKLMSKLRRG